jgi:hypothetical protein
MNWSEQNSESFLFSGIPPEQTSCFVYSVEYFFVGNCQPLRQPYAGVDFIPQSEIYEFGYRLLTCSQDTVILYTIFCKALTFF